MNDKELIERVKIAKAKGKIKNYYELASILEMTVKGVYNWLGGYYSISYKKKMVLNDYLRGLAE